MARHIYFTFKVLVILFRVTIHSISEGNNPVTEIVSPILSRIPWRTFTPENFLGSCGIGLESGHAASFFLFDPIDTVTKSGLLRGYVIQVSVGCVSFGTVCSYLITSGSSFGNNNPRYMRWNYFI